MPTVYRIFDQYGRLLYVGQTVKIAQRLQQHSNAQPWWSEVDEITCEHFDVLADAQAAEGRAITKELPRYNRMGAAPPTPFEIARREKEARLAERYRGMRRVPGGIECAACNWKGNWIATGSATSAVPCPVCKMQALRPRLRVAS